MKAAILILGGIIGVVLVVIVITSMPSPDGGDSLQYDDYIRADGAISAGGSMEIVEIAGVTYAHAKDVGEGYYKLSDGREVSCDVGKAVLDIVVAMGQSNNRYSCWDISQVSAFPEMGTAYYWGTEYEPVTNPNVTPVSIQTMRDPETGAVKLGDKIPVFSALWTEATGHKLLYVVTAVGGSSITSWVPGEQQYQRQIRILNQVTAALDPSLFEWSFACCTWIQGEADWQMELSEYSAYFGQMHDGLFSETYPHKLNYMVMATPRLGTAVEADRLAADEYENVFLATDIATTFTVANGLLGPDNTHWTQQGDNIVAEAMASEALSQSGGQPGSFIPVLVGLAAIVAVAGVVLGVRRDG